MLPKRPCDDDGERLLEVAGAEHRGDGVIDWNASLFRGREPVDVEKDAGHVGLVRQCLRQPVEVARLHRHGCRRVRQRDLRRRQLGSRGAVNLGA